MYLNTILNFQITFKLKNNTRNELGMSEVCGNHVSHMLMASFVTEYVLRIIQLC